MLGDIWHNYRRSFELRPIKEVQDLRAFSILWAAIFFPEAFSQQLRRSLSTGCQHYRDRADYGTHCWYSAMPLEAALFALSGERCWLSTVLNNLDHPKQSSRQIAIESLAPVANLLEFDGKTLARIGRNLEYRHFGCEEPVILFALSVGTGEEKREKIQRWLKEYTYNSGERKVLEDLANGHRVENPFIHRALRSQQYLVLQLSCPLPAIPEQLSLAEDVDRTLDRKQPTENTQGCLFADPTSDFAETVWTRMSDHPLTASLLRIEGL